MGDLEQLTGLAEPSGDIGGKLSSDAGVQAQPSTEKPATPDGSTGTGTAQGDGQQPTDSTDWKAKYEEERKERERLSEISRQHQSRADKAEAARIRMEQERAQRVNSVLSDPDLYAEVQSDPAKWKQFNSELVAVQMAERDESMRIERLNNEWLKTENDLREWCCTNKDGPGLTLQEFNEWNSKYGRSFGAQHYDPREGFEQAQVHIRGLHFSKFADRQQTIANKNADDAAKRTLKDANPPGSASVSIGKDKTPQERMYEELEELPRGNAAAQFYRTGK